MMRWEHLINRLKQEVDYQLRNNNSRKDEGVVYLEVRILAGESEPILWMVDGKKVEPGTKAKSLLELC